MAEKSLFENLLHCYDTDYMSDNVRRFESRVRSFIEDATPEEKERFFKMKPDFVSQLFMLGYREENRFYERLQKMNEERYLLPFLKLIASQIKEDMELGETLQEQLKKKKDERKWNVLYELTKHYSAEQLAKTLRSVLSNINKFDGAKDTITRVLLDFEFQKNHQM